MAPSSSAVAQLPLPLPDSLGLMPAVEDPAPRIGTEALADLHRRLGKLLGQPIDLVPTDNRRSLLSWNKGEHGLLTIRIQRHFALAGDTVLAEIGRLILSDDDIARKAILEYAEGFQQWIKPPKPRFTHPAGKHHDLRDHLAEQSRLWFVRRFSGRIGWSLVHKGRVRRRIRLGSWSEDHHLIRVHPVLDSPDVPDFVLGFVVFHEMLHATLGVEEVNGRRNVHTPEFRRLEAVHADRLRAEAWINDNLDSLLTW
jgi:hypothetical protein